MVKFHVNQVPGQYGRCESPENCPVSTSEDHFDKVNEALKVSEKRIAETFKNLREKGRNTVWEKPTDAGGDSY